MANFCHFANFGGNKLSNCNFGDANIFSYYYFIYIFYPVFISCVIVAWWAIFVVELRFIVGKCLGIAQHTYIDSDDCPLHLEYTTYLLSFMGWPIWLHNLVFHKPFVRYQNSK
jgi:hypothetical protein